ncbi:glutaredoxin family protein [Microbulbifer halophilus]|uniref:Glutaredoxin family protein n=1 Tax=Microbulbifer halophilus TaxID=453963 RepID=A0ABW5EJW0_9GAMM|nr:glutaredoxin family protein [Microbulbifer halophilus]MCW8128513.1 glutaredoxin family protein [Microbulbifer halophilus]
MGELILYTTLGCHLCEKAKPEIWPLLEPNRLRLKEVDIADDPDLAERFGTRIPVVGLGDPDDVCAWPFDRVQLADWLRQRL